MAQLQPPFALASYPALLSPDHNVDSHKPSSPPPPSFSTYPVLRLSASQRTPKLALQAIVTVPGQGWSIHKVSDQTILSSQKVSPSLVFTAPSVALSIPHIQQTDQKSEPISKSSTKKNRKIRTRYVYAAVASCLSDPSPAVNQGRTIWVWIEKEVNGGFGERDASNADPLKSSSANIVKEFPSRVEMVYPLPSSCPKDSPDTQLARLLVLLQSGDALLCSQDLTTIATCRIHSNPSPSIPIQAPYVRVQTHTKDQEFNTASNLIRHPGISILNSPGLLIYISRLKPEFSTPSEPLPTDSTPNTRASKKRKSVAAQPPKPISSVLTHYSHLEICVLEVHSDKLITLGLTSRKENFLDVAIGAPGWVTIMEPSHTLSTYLISRYLSSDLEVESMPSQDLTLIPHPQCNAIQLKTKLQSLEAASTLKASSPVLVPLPCSVPLVFVIVSHSTLPTTAPPTTCLGLVVDLYHQAVLFVLEYPWPTAPKHSQELPSGHEPLTVSATLSPLSQPPHIYLCLSYQSLRLVQVLQAPEFPPDTPSWVEVLNPVVTDATLSWIIQQSNGVNPPTKISRDRQKRLLLSEELLGCCTMSFSTKACPNEVPHLPTLKAFISRFNDVCLGGIYETGHWTAETSKAAEAAWAQCILCPSSGKQASESQDVDMAGNDSSDHAVDQLVTKFLRGSNSESKLRSILSKAFVHALLEICLGQFAADMGKELTSNLADQNSLRSGNRLSASSKPYPAQIIICLLYSGLVEQNMVAGGVVAALRRTGDVAAVEVAVSKLYDVNEYELVETILWIIQLQGSQPRVSGSKEAKNRQLSTLERLLSKIVSQPLSTGPLKKALRQTLDPNDILIIFRILNEWIEWWMEEGMEILQIDGHATKSLHPNPKPTEDFSGPASAQLPRDNLAEPVSNWSGLPDLARIFEFIECSLDAHLIGLIQYNEAKSILEALRLKLNWEIEIDTVLLGLSGPLTQSAKLIKQKQSRQKDKLASKQASSKDQKAKPKGSNSKASEPPNHRSYSNRTASKLSTKKNKTKRYKHPDARRLQGEISNAQSLAEYALERFNL